MGKSLQDIENKANRWTGYVSRSELPEVSRQSAEPPITG
jgi:hypothetical protein